jgi:hypothetical protein
VTILGLKIKIDKLSSRSLFSPFWRTAPPSRIDPDIEPSLTFLWGRPGTNRFELAC